MDGRDARRNLPVLLFEKRGALKFGLFRSARVAIDFAGAGIEGGKQKDNVPARPYSCSTRTGKPGRGGGFCGRLAGSGLQTGFLVHAHRPYRSASSFRVYKSEISCTQAAKAASRGTFGDNHRLVLLTASTDDTPVRDARLSGLAWRRRPHEPTKYPTQPDNPTATTSGRAYRGPSAELGRSLSLWDCREMARQLVPRGSSPASPRTPSVGSWSTTTSSPGGSTSGSPPRCPATRRSRPPSRRSATCTPGRWPRRDGPVRRREDQLAAAAPQVADAGAAQPERPCASSTSTAVRGVEPVRGLRHPDRQGLRADGRAEAAGGVHRVPGATGPGDPGDDHGRSTWSWTTCGCTRASRCRRGWRSIRGSCSITRRCIARG